MTEVKTRLFELAERCEKAAEPDRELDFYIWAALNGVTEIANPAEGHPMTPGRGGRVEGRDERGEWHLYGFVDPGKVNRNWTPYGGEDRYPKYTASIDAAATLADRDQSLWFLLTEAAKRCAMATEIGTETEFRTRFPAFVSAAVLRARD